MHLGRERVIGCWQVDDVLIDPGPSSCLPTLLRRSATSRPRALLLTHIHLDHAGATGTLVERWPELEVYVHERGARHMADPARLVESARRLYGEDMDRLWGEMLPVPEANLHVLSGGERDPRRRLRGRLHAGSRLPPRLLPARRYRVRGRRRRSADHRRLDDDPAHAAARHRRRGLARVDRADPRLEPRAAGHDPLRRRRGPAGSARRARRAAGRMVASWPATSTGRRSSPRSRPDPRATAAPSRPRPTSRRRRSSSSTPATSATGASAS